MNIQELPLEIHEHILSYLDMVDLVAAARSWVLWRQVGNLKLFERWCLKNISPEVLDEITENQLSGTVGSPLLAEVRDGYDWVDVLTKWSKTTCNTQIEPDSKAEEEAQILKPTVITEYCVCMAVSGDLFIIGDNANNVVWYDCNGVQIAKKSNLSEPVLALDLLNICRREPYMVSAGKYSVQHDAVVAVSNNFIAIYSMPTWNCQELYFQSIALNTRNVSALGNQFAYFNRNQLQMTVCVVQKHPYSQCDSKLETTDYPCLIKVKPRCTFSTTHNLLNFKLWKNSVICMLQNGTIMTWNIDEATFSKPIFISEFLYPSVSFLYRGLIFCNISTAIDLLRYWHVAMGEPHWFMSTDGLNFKRVNTSISSNEEISSLHVKRTMIVAGTSCGKICIYRHTGSDHSLPDVFNQQPSLIYKIAHKPIYNCDFSVDGDDMIILAKTEPLVLLLIKLPVTEKYD